MNEFVSRLRGTLNQLLVGTFTMASIPTWSNLSTEIATGGEPKHFGGPTTKVESALQPTSVDLWLLVSREVSPYTFVPVAATHPRPSPAGLATRDMKKVPPSLDQVVLRTGDRVRIQVSADRPGFLTVLDVGPAGNLNLLYPDGDPLLANRPRPVEANRPLHIVDVEMSTPPVTKSSGSASYGSK